MDNDNYSEFKMDYIACLKVAQNDIKALINLEKSRKEKVAPLLELRGKKTDKHLQKFLDDWGDSSFFMDFCQTESDEKRSQWLTELLTSKNAFKGKRDKFIKISTSNQNMIPVVSWQDNDSVRDVVQFALKVERLSAEFAIRINMISNHSWLVCMSVLNAIDKLCNVTVILDFQDKLKEASGVLDKVLEINKYKVKQVVLLSTSFPLDKPPSGQTIQVNCVDYSWQSKLRKKLENTVIYGDYAASNPFSTIDFIPGMRIIPFACYFTPFEWWMRREGSDKEYKCFRNIAREIEKLPFFHGESYCWATKEISRIAKLDDNTEGGHGSNGTWNGYKSNQHICTMLDYLTIPPATLGIEELEDSEE